MKPATVAPEPIPKLPATRASATEAARCSGLTNVMVNTPSAVPATPSPAPLAIEQVLAAAQDFQHPDSSYRLETWWDLWQFDADWKLTPSRAALVCFGPEFDREDDAHLEIEFGIDAHFLPQPEIPGSIVTIQSNIKSLLKLVHDLDDALPVETRRLWSESGENFSEKLQQALQASGG